MKIDDTPAASFVVLEDNVPIRQLSSLLQSSSFFLAEAMSRLLFRDILTGVLSPRVSQPHIAAILSLHASGCIHRRIRETSFVVSEEGIAKLIEFGCSGIPPMESDPRLNLFRPPEYNIGVPVDASLQSKADVWSLGTLLVIMTTGGIYLI